MVGPASSYSSLVIHMEVKVEREAKIDPPIQTEYFLSGGATILMCCCIADINITFLDGVEDQVVDTSVFNSVHGWLEKNFWASESFCSNGNDLSIWKFVVDFNIRG